MFFMTNSYLLGGLKIEVIDAIYRHNDRTYISKISNRIKAEL